MVVRIFELAVGNSGNLESIYGQEGSYSLLCRKFDGYCSSTLRWLGPANRLCEHVERWESEWKWHVFRLTYRAEREEIAEQARTLVLSARIVERYYE